MIEYLKKNRYVIYTFLIIVVIVFSGYKYNQISRMNSEPVKLAEVTKGTLKETVSATGSLAALNNVDISSKITGRIIEVLVKENQYVNAGDILVRLDDTALRATLAQMQARMHDAALTYNRYQTLLNRGAVSQATFDTVYADYLVAKSNYEKAVSDVNDTVIKTPISGYIIGKPIPVGQTISSGISEPQVIMSVATLDDMEIEVLVDESDIGKVKVGQMVNFTVDSFPNEIFSGKVRLVSRKALTENNVIYYKVYVKVSDAKGKLLPTMTARVDIIIDEVKDALLIPLNCVYTEGSKRYVKVYDSETKLSRNVDINTGLSNDSSVVVKETSLKEGEKLLVKKAIAKQSANRLGSRI